MRKRFEVLWFLLICLSGPIALVANSSDGLIISGQHDSLELIENQKFSYQLEITNEGKAVQHLSVEAYWSLDEEWDEEDIEMGSVELLGLYPGLTKEANFQLETNVESGGWYLLIRAVQKDDAEDKNAGSFHIVPAEVLSKEVDFVPLKVVSKSLVHSPGTKSHFDLRYQNEGNTSALDLEFLEYEIYLSADQHLDEEDQLLKKSFTQLTSSSPMRESSLTTEVTFPDTPSGDKMYVIARLDYLPIDGVEELDTTNNTKSVEIKFSEPQSNILLNIVSNIKYFGCNFLVGFKNKNVDQRLLIELVNNGNLGVTEGDLKFYQSKDRRLDVSDILFDSLQISLEPHVSKAEYPLLQPDASKVEEGYRYVLIVADPLDEIDEIVETDNLQAIEFVYSDLGMELLFSNIETEGIGINTILNRMLNIMPEGWAEGIQKSDQDTLLVEGSTIWHLDILDGNFADSVEIGFFFSMDHQFSYEQDVLLYSEKFVLTQGGFDFSVEVPLGAIETAEEGYLMAFIDPYDELPEYVRSNNLAAFPLVVEQTPEPGDSVEINPRLVYPNPFNQEIHLQDSTAQFQLFDISGKLVLQGENTNHIDVPEIAKGIYLLRTKEGKQFKVLRE